MLSTETLADQPQHRIVLIGGGYASIDAYKALARRLGGRLRSGAVQVTVINPDAYHTFHGWTGEVLAGLLPLDVTLTPLEPLFRYARVLLGRASGVDLAARTVSVETPDGGQETLPYDELLIGTGSSDPFERVPGLREYGWRLKDTRDMQRFQKHLLALVTDRAAPGSVVPARVLVIGGGFAGVEMAGAIRELAGAHSAKVDITLMTSSDQLLDVLRPKHASLADHAAGELEKLGVQVRYAARVRCLTPQGIELESGEALPFELVLYTAGVAFTVLPGTENLARTAGGQLLVDKDLRVQGQPHVWVAGDAARVALPRGEGYCPVNALWAMKQGMCVGNNMAAVLAGKPPRAFAYGGLGQSASLRVGGGVTELLGVPLTGWIGWIARLAFFIWFMPSKVGGWRVLRAWMQLGQKRTLKRGKPSGLEAEAIGG